MLRVLVSSLLEQTCGAQVSACGGFRKTWVVLDNPGTAKETGSPEVFSFGVAHHGIPYPGYSSKLLTLLNQVDITTGPTGEYMTIEERLQDIGNRYGKDSRQLQDAMCLADSQHALSNAQNQK